MNIFSDRYIFGEITKFLRLCDVMKLRVCKKLLVIPYHIDCKMLCIIPGALASRRGKRPLIYYHYGQNGYYFTKNVREKYAIGGGDYYQIDPILVNELSRLTGNEFKLNYDAKTSEYIGNVYEYIIHFLRKCYSNHDNETLKALMRMKINWIENANLLCVAVEYNEFEIVKWLLDIGYSANGYSSNCIPYGKKRPIYISSFNGNYEITKLLLDYGADPNPEKNTPYDPENPPTTNPIFEAIKKNYYDIVKLLLDYGCDPNAYGDQFNELEVPLFVAISCNNIELTRLLLDRGAKLDYTTIKYLREGYTNNIHGVLKRYSCNNEHMINLLKEYGLKS